MFFHELLCNSGFGDRILDLWTIVTIKNILNKTEPLLIKWKSGTEYPGFNSCYSTDLFTIKNCKWATSNDYFISIRTFIGENSQIWGNYMNQKMDFGIIQKQIFPINTFWGTTNIERIQEALPFYGTISSNSKVAEVYYKVANSMCPNEKLKNLLVFAKDLEYASGIHIRLSDKCVDMRKLDPFTMTRENFNNIKEKCKEYIATNKGIYFVCSEDKTELAKMQEFILENGSYLITLNYNDLREDEIALLDFFALSRCQKILQCTKYSTFSIAASIVNQIPLINFHGYDNNALAIWSNTAKIILL